MANTQITEIHADALVPYVYAKRAISIANKYNEMNNKPHTRKVVELQPLTLENLMNMTIDERLITNVDLPQDTSGEVVEVTCIHFKDGKYYLDMGRTIIITNVTRNSNNTYDVTMYKDKKEDFGWMLLFGNTETLDNFDFLDSGECTTNFIMKVHYEVDERPQSLISKVCKDAQTLHLMQLIKESRVKFNKR